MADLDTEKAQPGGGAGAMRIQAILPGRRSWTQAAKKTRPALYAGQCPGREVDRAAWENQRKPVEARPGYRVCEVASEIRDATGVTPF
ncbi:MAG: hypothetical protein JXB85_16965, partial [Anaerolineales bacterium]|nr:hypothetical protein [Anaerolineales bacterium]